MDAGRPGEPLGRAGPVALIRECDERSVRNLKGRSQTWRHHLRMRFHAIDLFQRLWLRSALVLAFALSALMWLGTGRLVPATEASEDMLAAFCTSPPAAAVVPIDTPADVKIGVLVPSETPVNPILDERVATPAEVRRNAVLEFDVQSPRRGGLAVHGLSDLVRIERGQRVKVRLRAIYSGRFPLHFHGIDGSHFEIAVVEVRD